jgi:hypothetical protein
VERLAALHPEELELLVVFFGDVADEAVHSRG